MPVATHTVQAVFDAFSAAIPGRVSRAQEVLDHHARDHSWHPPHLPDLVCFPESTKDVVAIATICAEHRVPMIPFGVGSSLEGGPIPLEGGVSIDMQRMDKVLRVSPADRDCTVQAGVCRLELNEHLAPYKLFFPVNPGANASIGGMTATRASGSNAMRYGTMRENVLALEVVLADGRRITTAGRARKSAAGYDLTRLFTGSEGTLGIITEITLKLYPIPEARAVTVMSFETIPDAVNTIIDLVDKETALSRIELLDSLMMKGVNGYSGLSYPEQPTLFIEIEGKAHQMDGTESRVGAVAKKRGGMFASWQRSDEERNRLWQARYDVYYAMLSLRPGTLPWSTDVCVPISNLAECIAFVQEDLANTFLNAPLVGHVGDGNFHLAYLIDREVPEEVAEAKRLNDRMVRKAIELGGTCTGEHGVGIGKKPFMDQEHGEAVAVFRSIKQALDPDGLMNPGKVLP